jgi:uncharacterized membrane protein YfcA
MLADLAATTIALVVLGGFLGGVASGAAGFAYGVVASSIWLHVISPVHVALLVVGAGLINQAGLVWAIRRTIDLPRVWPFLIGGAIGIPLGVLLVVGADPRGIRTGLAVFMIVYGVYVLSGLRLPHVASRGFWAGRFADGVAGFLGGLCGGIAGLSGIAPAVWTQVRGWPKETARGVYQPFIVMAHVLTLLLIGAVSFDRTGAVLLLIAVPAVLLGSWTGWKIYGLLSEKQFVRMLAALLIGSGLLLIF